MKLNNKGWGLTVFLFLVLILLVFFLIAISKLNLFNS